MRAKSLIKSLAGSAALMLAVVPMISLVSAAAWGPFPWNSITNIDTNSPVIAINTNIPVTNPFTATPIKLFVKGLDNAIYTNTNNIYNGYNNTNTTVNWVPFGGSAKGDIAYYQDAYSVYFAVRGLDDQIYFRQMDIPSGRVLNWLPTGIFTNTDPKITAGLNDTTLIISALDKNNNVLLGLYNPLIGYTINWVPQGVQSVNVATLYTNNYASTIYMAFRGLDNTIYNRSFWRGASGEKTFNGSNWTTGWSANGGATDTIFMTGYDLFMDFQAVRDPATNGLYLRSMNSNHNDWKFYNLNLSKVYDVKLVSTPTEVYVSILGKSAIDRQDINSGVVMFKDGLTDVKIHITSNQQTEEYTYLLPTHDGTMYPYIAKTVSRNMYLPYINFDNTVNFIPYIFITRTGINAIEFTV